jgi:CheY-like chemotaxis protein
VSQKGATTIRPLSAHAAETVQTAHGSLLVVDDQEINRDMLSRRLERRGYTVAAAGDGCQAMEMITTQNLDLVLLAIMMSRISGLEVLKILCA